jgi:HEAT repeat protein
MDCGSLLGVSREVDEPLLPKRLRQAWTERDSPYVIEWLRRFPNQEVAILAIGWLADWGETKAAPELAGLLRVANVSVRRAAAHALADLGSPLQAHTALEQVAVEDSDSATRSWCLAALARYRDPDLLPLLTESLSDKDWRVRNGAAVALGELGDRRALAPLRARLRRMWRRPWDWYLCRHAWKNAIQALTR